MLSRVTFAQGYILIISRINCYPLWKVGRDGNPWEYITKPFRLNLKVVNLTWLNQACRFWMYSCSKAGPDNAIIFAMIGKQSTHWVLVTLRGEIGGSTGSLFLPTYLEGISSNMCTLTWVQNVISRTHHKEEEEGSFFLRQKSRSVASTMFPWHAKNIKVLICSLNEGCSFCFSLSFCWPCFAC